MLFFFGLLWLAVFVLNIVAGWKIYEKAGQPGWASILVPIANVVYAIWMINMLSKSFGKDEGFTIGLLLLGVVFWPVLGLGDAKYIGPYGDPVAFKAAQSPQFDFDSPATAQA